MFEFMAEGDIHTCLICQADFGDSLEFYEHVMEHGEDESDEEEMDDLPCQEPSADLTDGYQSEGHVADSYPCVPTIPDGTYFSMSPPLSVSAPRLPHSYSMEPITTFTAQSLLSPQQLTAGIPYRFAYRHVPVSTPPTSPHGPPAPYLPGTGSYQNPTARSYTDGTVCIDLTQDEMESQDIGIPNAKSIGQQYREMEEFTTRFKGRRVKMGYTQASVGVAMERHYGIAFSQTTVSRFEAMQLNFHNLAKLRPLFEEWLDYEEREINKTQENRAHFRRRKKRTSFQPQAKRALESYFKQQPTPNSGEYAVLADALGLSKEVVRIWFCNRRQKERKAKQERNQPNDGSQQLSEDDEKTEMPSEGSTETFAVPPGEATVPQP